MENKDKETVSLKIILVRYLRKWKLFLLVFIISIIPALLYLNFYPRTYEFSSSVLLQEEQESAMSSLGFGEAAGLMKSFGIGGGGGTINIEDEMEVMMSNRVMRLMINELGLNVSYSKPYSFYYMYNEAPLKLTTSSGAMAEIDDDYRFDVSVKPGNIKVVARSRFGGFKETFNYTSLPAAIKVGKQEFTIDFDNGGSQQQSFKLQIRCQPSSWTAETLANNILIEDISKASNVLTLTCSEHSKERGLDMLEMLVKKYNADRKAFSDIDDYKTMEFVDSRISVILVDLAVVEGNIETYKKSNDMTLLEADVLLYSEVYKELQTQLVEVEVQARQIGMLDEYVRNPENKFKTIPALYSAVDGEKGAVGEYNKAIVERERFLKNSNEENRMFQNATIMVDKLRDGVFVMIDNAKKTMDSTLADLKEKERQMVSNMKTIPEKEREYRILMRDQEILQGLYVMMLQKKEETIMSLGKQTDLAKVIETPYIKKKPLGPRKLFAGIGMLVFTLVGAVGYLFLKDLLISIKEELKSSEK